MVTSMIARGPVHAPMPGGEAGSRARVPAPGDALLVVDMQRDFLPGGALGVAGAPGILERVNACLVRFAAAARPIFASRDWHPADHRSFASQGGPWPPHCVAHTPGAEFAQGLRLPPGTGVVSKGCEAGCEGYSAFDHTDLHHRLRYQSVRRLFVVGLATDYCVLASVLDARRLGYEVIVVADAVAAVQREAGDGERALKRMRDAGASTVDSATLFGAALQT
jgi:nicotinamidase/pyrazinamidase